MTTERINVVVQESGTRTVQRRLATVGTAAASSAGGVNLLRSALLSLGGAAILRSTIGTLANFEQQISTVEAISGASASQLRELEGAARDLGATTRFSASEAASGLVFLSRAGFTVEEQLDSLEGTLKLAQAGALDLGTAADIASNVLRGFRLEAAETGRAVDVLAFTANNSNTNVQQLGDALKFVAPVASGVGVEMEETAAAIGALSDAGLQATLAGTGLRRVISELESPASKTRRILESLGLEANDVRISQVGLTNALIALRDAGVDTGQALQIFGDRGGPAFEVLSSSIPQVVRMTEELDNAGGTADEIARIMDDNLNGALLAVRSRFESLVLAFGDAGPTNALTLALRALARILTFAADNVEILATLIGVRLAAFAIPRAIVALQALRVALIGSGVGAIVVLLGTAVAALVSFSDRIRITSDGLATLGDLGTAIFNRLQELIRNFVSFLQATFPDISGLFEGVFEGFEFSLEGFLNIAAAGIDTYVSLWVGGTRAILEVGRALGPALQDVFAGIANSIINIFENVVDSISAVLVGIGRTFESFGGRIRLALLSLGQALDQLARGEFGNAAESIRDALFQIEAGTEGITARIGANISQALQDLGDDTLIPRLEQSSVSASERIAAAIQQGFAIGFAQVGTPIGSLLDSLFEEAERIAQERAAMVAAEGTRGEGGTGGPQTPAPAARGLEEALARLDREAQLLRLSSAEREVRNELLRIENELINQGVQLDAEGRERLEAELRQLRQLNEINTVLDEVRGSELDLAAAQEELTTRLEQGSITAGQAAIAFSRLQRIALESSTSVQAGFVRGFAQINELLNDFSVQAETTLVNAFRSAEDAFVDFVSTGQFSFSNLIDSMISDLARLAFQQAVGGVIGGLTGGSAGFAGSLGGFLFGGGRAAGGPVDPGQSFLVGERGPELFTPAMPGMITPTQAPQQPPQVNVSVVNITDPDEITSVMGTPEGERVILNTIRRNRRAIREVNG